MRLLKILAALSLILVLSGSAAATSLLVSQGQYGGYGYGFSSWGNMTSALDAATGNQVTVTSNFGNLSQMMSYDALWLDLRAGGSSLSASEASNLTSFIGTGRKIVMIGENSSWTTWDNSLLGVVGGGSFSGNGNGSTTPVVANSLTNGVSSVYLPASGTTTGGTALFNQNWATLWGNNVLTLLDVNVMSNSYWSDADNGLFMTNVANWIANSEGGNGNNGGPTVPVPGAVLLGSLGMGLVSLIRKRQLL